MSITAATSGCPLAYIMYLLYAAIPSRAIRKKPEIIIPEIIIPATDLKHFVLGRVLFWMGRYRHTVIVTGSSKPQDLVPRTTGRIDRTTPSAPCGI